MASSVEMGIIIGNVYDTFDFDADPDPNPGIHNGIKWIWTQVLLITLFNQTKNFKMIFLF